MAPSVISPDEIRVKVSSRGAVMVTCRIWPISRARESVSVKLSLIDRLPQ